MSILNIDCHYYYYYTLILTLIVHCQSSSFYPNEHEPRVFDHIPSHCYDCLSHRDLIFDQLTTIPSRAFANYNFGSRNTNLIFNGQSKLQFQPYAFHSLHVEKPNRTMTITLRATNSWLNITEKAFDGLKIDADSTLKIIVQSFYACTFHRHSLTGIEMAENSRLIFDLSSLTQIVFQSETIGMNSNVSSIEFFISRSETVEFESFAFSQLKISSRQTFAFEFQFISQISFASRSFNAIDLEKQSSFQIDALFLNRFNVDSNVFNQFSFADQTEFQLKIRTLASNLCLPSSMFNRFHQIESSDNARIRLIFSMLRGLSFLPASFSNVSMKFLEIHAENSLKDPNPIVNFAANVFASMKRPFTSIVFNFSSVSIVRFEPNSIVNTNGQSLKIYLKFVTLVDISFWSMVNVEFHLDRIDFVQWPKEEPIGPSMKIVFANFSNDSCAIYDVRRTIDVLDSTQCNCPSLFVVQHRPWISCTRNLSNEQIAQQIEACRFDDRINRCRSTLNSILNNETSTTIFEIDTNFIRQVYDRNFLTCSLNYSFSTSTLLIRSRLFDKVGLVIGVILIIFIILLILLMALLNGLQYKMREYDESWTWRRNVSWNSLRRTWSQNSLRRSRRDLRNLNINGFSSKSDNQLDRLQDQTVEQL